MKKRIFNVLITVIIIIAILFGINIKVLAASANTVEENTSSSNTENSAPSQNSSPSTNTNTSSDSSNSATGSGSSNTNSGSSSGSSGSTNSGSTGSASNSGGSNSTRNTNNTTTNTSSSNNAENSSNANLSNLGIRPNDFSGFKPSVTIYDVTVPEDVDSVEVYATAQSSSAEISGTGTIDLDEGTTTVEVTVTAEDGTTKTYTLNITRGAESSENDSDSSSVSDGNGLKSLTVNDLQLDPEFDTNTYNYTVKYIGEDTSLNVQAEPTSEDYDVEIVGNENLQEGENTITILVADDSGENVATYQVIVNKSLVDEEAIARQEAQERQQKMLIIAGAVILLIIIIVTIIIVKKRKSKNYAEEFSGVPFYGMNKENAESEKSKDLKKDNEAEDYDLPKALRKEANLIDDDNKDLKDSDKNRHGKRFK